jgi:CheY-like chemotaxis protein
MKRRSEIFEAMPRGKTILVVDDSATVRKLISGKLEKSGHHVVCAEDGLEALERLEASMPDLVLLDIAMPKMDGYEVCKQIRLNPAAKDLPIVMISGKDGFFDKVRGRMAGTTGYVTKPFGPETLMKAIETYLLPDQPAEA